ncbi:peptidylprolyl isomerase [Candidatus Collinsella stercoripullorum]|uniref:peptidylprolyl isomerase n=1 Tax=Candidatus Collinsella stercoripullorum TaxID=2838522 RepID=UPI0022E58AC6|nr:peptidylprolyl isomerase [Candidatus Collinsella stercoripullorum]
MNKKPRIKREQEPAAPSARERKQERKEKMSKGVKIVLVAIGCLAMLLSVTTMACSGFLNEATTEESYHLTGGVAATVDGVNITEDTVTKQIMSVRTAYGYGSDGSWAQYLVDNGLTPETYREQVIDSYANQYLQTQAINEYDASATDEEVESAWNDAVENSGGDEKSFIESLATYGYTESSYKESLRNSLELDKLRSAVASVDDPTDQQIVDYLNENLSTYNDARRSSNILISVASDATDEEKAEAQAKAQEALDKINSGELIFEEAADQYSDDTASKEDGGDVGWDKLTTFVTEYQDALSQLSVDQVSGLVESTYGYHIIKCTDYFHVDGQVSSIDEVPTEIRDYISNIVKTDAEGDAYTTWWNDYKEQANIEINPMPEDVPYNVSLDGVEPSSGSTE